jgi:hypothetical protein
MTRRVDDIRYSAFLSGADISYITNGLSILIGDAGYFGIDSSLRRSLLISLHRSKLLVTQLMGLPMMFVMTLMTPFVCSVILSPCLCYS